MFVLTAEGRQPTCFSQVLTNPAVSPALCFHAFIPFNCWSYPRWLTLSYASFFMHADGTITHFHYSIKVTQELLCLVCFNSASDWNKNRSVQSENDFTSGDTNQSGLSEGLLCERVDWANLEQRQRANQIIKQGENSWNEPLRFSLLLCFLRCCADKLWRKPKSPPGCFSVRPARRRGGKQRLRIAAMLWLHKHEHQMLSVIERKKI